MKTTLLNAFALGVALLIAGTAFGHHGTQISYQLDKNINLSGTVTDWVFAFPHPSVFFEVKDENGKTVKWGSELLPTPANMRSWNVGWSRTTIKPGDQINLTCNPSKAGNPVCVARQMTINGKLMPLNDPAAPQRGGGGGRGQ